jgi:hypothetical protein
VAQGRGHELYNATLQHEFQARYFGEARSYMEIRRLSLSLRQSLLS